jgi:hypothetical protein
MTSIYPTAMRILLFLTILLPISGFAAPGDTVLVTTHNNVLIRTNPAVGSTDYVGWGNFPTTDVHKILMKLNFSCPPGESCGEWDYLNYIYIRRVGGQNGSSLDLELARYITPYGLGYGPTWRGEWLLDVSDFAGLLKDSVEIQYRHTGFETNVGRGWIVDLEFVCIEGPPARDFIRVNKLWNGNFSYGNQANPINTQLAPKSITLNANTQLLRSYIVQTGHSFGDPENCAEFCPKQRTLRRDGTPYSTKLVWRDNCGENPNFPQAGTWLYDRSAWCPGDIAYPDVVDLPASGGATHEFRMEMENYVNQGTNSPNYVIESFLFEYGESNIGRDVSIEDIAAPSRHYYHSRYNPICGKPIVRIQNNGSEVLTSCIITYGDKNGAKSSFTWTGSLNQRETATVELLANVAWNTGGTFEAVVSSPNGQSDELSFNNRMESQYLAPLELPESFVVNIRSNNFGNETSWKITDMQGNIVASRSSFANNTEYRDTVTLPWGCYRFMLEDSDEDGLAWWANNDGDGFVRFRKISSGFHKFWGGDFGSNIIQEFTVGGALNTADAVVVDNKTLLYPNPSAEGSQLEIILKQPEQAQIQIVSAAGQVVKTYTLASNNWHQLQLEKPTAAGIYLIQVQAGEYRKTVRWVVE